MKHHPRSARLRVVLISLVTAVLLGGIFCQVGMRFLATRPPPPVPVDHLLPAQLSGWESRELTLGPTEAVSAFVIKTLNFSSAYYREFKRPGLTVTVYAAHWAPGRMPVEDVQGHRPDTCWREAGWRMTAVEHHKQFPESSFAPGEWRRFETSPGQIQYVQYWHLVNGEPFDYTYRYESVGAAWRVWRAMVNQAIKGEPEQYFIRITCDEPFEVLARHSEWRQFLKHFDAFVTQRS